MSNNRICSTEFRIDVRIAHRARTASTNCSSVNSPWTNFSKRSRASAGGARPKELAGLWASVSDDMDHVKQGVLSKDAFEKLKRMEKLAKRVREELTQTSTTP
jgi:hypothetical protein